MAERRLTIDTPKGKVSALFTPGKGRIVFAAAHGAGSNKESVILAGFAEGLEAEGIGCLRFNFPYAEAGKRGPDSPPVLLETWRAAFERAASLAGAVWVGGRSMGGRIASMAVAEGMPAAGLIFLAYPLHPPGKPERIRDEHLPSIGVPMLFIQGTRDPFAQPDLLARAISKIGPRAHLRSVDGGDHSFRVSGAKIGDRSRGLELAKVAADFIAESR